MDLGAFLPPLAAATKMRDADLLERDVRLHLLLAELMADSVMAAELMFKGGTCLAKCFLDYLRFSEDLDFTWKTQPSVRGETTKTQRKPFDDVRREVVKRVDAAAQRAALTRRLKDGLKVDRDGQLLTLWYVYDSAGGGHRTLKFEVSFRELSLYPPVPMKAQSLLVGPPSGPLLLADEEVARVYTTPIPVTSYDLREIRAEKARAFLTRGAVRGRDFLDLYEIDRRGSSIEDAVADATAKVRYSVAHWERYQINPFWTKQLDAVVQDSEAQRLALRAPPQKELDAFALRLKKSMQQVDEGVKRSSRLRLLD